MSVKVLKGMITSTRMEKTAIVRVGVSKQHKRYGKRYTAHKKYKAHYEDLKVEEGNLVLIEEVRPISKAKRWKIKEVLK